MQYAHQNEVSMRAVLVVFGDTVENLYRIEMFKLRALLNSYYRVERTNLKREY